MNTLLWRLQIVIDCIFAVSVVAGALEVRCTVHTVPVPYTHSTVSDSSLPLSYRW